MMLQNRIRRCAMLVLVASIALLLLPSVVLAHAQLQTATPADKSKLTTPVTEVSGTFTQRVKADGSKLVVKAASGATVAQGGVDPSNNKRMVATPATPLGSGAYLVEWTTISLDDGELARGTWTFTVAVAPTPSPTPITTPAPSAAVTPQPTPAPTPSPSAAPTPVPSANGSSTGSGGDVVLPIVIALIILGAGAAYLLSRRNRPPSIT